MAMSRLTRNRRTPRRAEFQDYAHQERLPALAAPLSVLPAPLEHGAVGVWDEVAVGALLVGCAIAYVVWFYLSGRNERPHDSE